MRCLTGHHFSQFPARQENPIVASVNSVIASTIVVLSPIQPCAERITYLNTSQAAFASWHHRYH